MSQEGMDRLAREVFAGESPRAFSTNPDDPENGRIFIWTKSGWFERVEGPWGNVAFSPVAEDETQLREWLSHDNPDLDLTELDRKTEHGRMVCDEFMENLEYNLYPESPESSSEPPFDEQDAT
ncbi:MAG: hypothetical protein PHU23_15075 [Dehalococcoidales bacterium]|nr:hypothetical protein [Dehalococcoidales bacterium]